MRALEHPRTDRKSRRGAGLPLPHFPPDRAAGAPAAGEAEILGKVLIDVRP